MTFYLISFLTLIGSIHYEMTYDKPCSEIDMIEEEDYRECVLEGDGGKLHKQHCRKAWADKNKCGLRDYPNKTVDESFTGREDL